MNAPAETHLGEALKRRCLVLAVECVGEIGRIQALRDELQRTPLEDLVARFLERSMLAFANMTGALDSPRPPATHVEPLGQVAREVEAKRARGFDATSARSFDKRFADADTNPATAYELGRADGYYLGKEQKREANQRGARDVLAALGDPVEERIKVNPIDPGEPIYVPTSPAFVATVGEHPAELVRKAWEAGYRAGVMNERFRKSVAADRLTRLEERVAKLELEQTMPACTCFEVHPHPHAPDCARSKHARGAT